MINLKNYKIEIKSTGVSIEHLSGPDINESEAQDIKDRIIGVYNEYELKVIEVLKPYIRKENLDNLLDE